METCRWEKENLKEGVRTEPDKKKSETAIVKDDEKFELEDSAWLKRKYKSKFHWACQHPAKESINFQ